MFFTQKKVLSEREFLKQKSYCAIAFDTLALGHNSKYYVGLGRSIIDAAAIMSV